MRAELERKLINRWPTWFDLGGDTRHTMLPFGFEHDDGWFDLLWHLCESLEPIVAAAEQEPDREFEVLQVKQKFGGLRFYTSSKRESILELIEAAEVESFHTCEVCGLPGRRRGGSWIQTLCDPQGCAQQTRDDDRKQNSGSL